MTAGTAPGGSRPASIGAGHEIPMACRTTRHFDASATDARFEQRSSPQASQPLPMAL